MLSKSKELEDRALRLIAERKIEQQDVFRFLRENFEMSARQAVDVASRSVVGTARYLAAIKSNEEPKK